MIAEIKELACALPATSGVPLSRWSASELAAELIARDVVGSISSSTEWRVLDGVIANDARPNWSSVISRGTTIRETMATAVQPGRVRPISPRVLVHPGTDVREHEVVAVIEIECPAVPTASIDDGDLRDRHDEFAAPLADMGHL